MCGVHSRGLIDENPMTETGIKQYVFVFYCTVGIDDFKYL